MIGRVRARVRAGRESWRRRRLFFWLGMMAACERRQLTDCELYYWFARKAMACNAWRRP
jgi:hypothetical protein